MSVTQPQDGEVFEEPAREEPGMWHIERWAASPLRWDGTGWGGRGWMQSRLGQDGVFTDEKAAIDYAINWCNDRASTLQRQVHELLARRGRFIAGELR
jgi:hypothetical protein